MGLIKSRGERVFDALNTLAVALLCVSILYPFVYLLSLSFSSGDIATSRVTLLPQNPSVVNYTYMLNYAYIWSGIRNTLFRTVVGTALTLMCCVITAYPLSKKTLPHRTAFTAFMVFTMFFSGGLIPWALNIKDLGLRDSLWSLVLPGLVPTYSMLIMRNYFMSIPDAVEESAKIDGAHDYTVLFAIVVPMSMPIMATVALWIIVNHWNAYFDSLIYISSMDKQVLQVVMRTIVIGTEGSKHVNTMIAKGGGGEAATGEALKAAAIIITTVPIVLVYPFLQKYFVKGVLVGSLKG